MIINHLCTAVQHSDAFQHLSFLGKVDFFLPVFHNLWLACCFQGAGGCQVSLRTPNICVVNWTVLLRLDPISDVQTLLYLLHVLYSAVQVLCIYFVIQQIKCGRYSRGTRCLRGVSVDFCCLVPAKQQQHLVHIT